MEPAARDVEQTRLYNIDEGQWQSVVRKIGRTAVAEEMIKPAVSEYTGWFSTMHLVSSIQELHSEAERIRRREVARTLNKMDLSSEQERMLEYMSRSIVNKLLHGPISELKAAAGQPLTPDDGVEQRCLPNTLPRKEVANK